ncbi:MAG: DUF560 domain-containing protein [Alphaproteobacteria bacterium]|nr:DUF560 domain-containing protein [Alphaproteobacteria bacterium]
MSPTVLRGAMLSSSASPCRALALAACLLFALLSAPRAGAQSSDPADAIEVPSPQELIDAGRFEEAFVLLQPQLLRETIEPNTLFLYGLAAVGAAQRPGRTEEEHDALLDEAIAAFHALLVRNPALVRVRLELARAFFLKGEDELARRHFEHVLAGEPPEAVADNVNLFLAEIRARKRWSFNLGFAVAPDTNIGGTSDERTITIFGLPFERDAEELTRSGIGLSFWGGAEYQAPVSDSLRIRAGAQASRREYARSDFDQHFVGLHLGPRWLLDASTEASLLASARQRWSGAPDYHDLGVRLEAAHRLGPRVTASAQTSWHDRRYRTRTHLDGPVWDATLRGSWVVTPTVRADVSGGYAQQRPKSRRERHRGRWLGTGITVALPLGFTVGGSAEMRWTDYERGWFPYVADNGPREDRTRSYRLSAFNRALTLMGFSPELAVVRETRDSNAQLHGYSRTSGELRFVQQF